MSAAATAAGYLYASGRLRGKGAREGAEAEQPKEPAEKANRRELRVAVYAPEQPRPQAAAPKKTPRIEYRTRRWKPE
jgi:hypothetical protein